MRLFLLIMLLLLIGTIQANAQLFKKKDADQKSPPRHFKYYEYWDADSTMINARGHYCYGKPCKTWRYFHQNGKVRMKVKYRDRLKIKYYRENGQLEKKGYAILDLDSRMIHFYWQGTWKYFDDRRRLYRKALFENGSEVMLIMGPEDPLYFE